MKWKEKLGNYLIDISKYFFIGVFVASLVKDMEGFEFWIEIVGIVVTIVSLVAGLLLIEQKKED